MKAFDILRLLLLIQLWELAYSHDSSSPGGPPGGFSPSSSDVSLHAFQPPLSLPCHYSSIGFARPVSIEDHMQQSVDFIENPDTNVYPVASTNKGFHIGKVFHLATKSGAELWGAATKDSEFEGYDPHFAGPSRVLVRLTKKGCVLNVGVFEGWAARHNKDDDDDEENNSQQIPLQLEFDCPSYALFGVDLDIPTTCVVQIAAFAHWVQVFDSLEDYNRYNDKIKAKGKISFADRFFMRLDFLNNSNEDKDEEGTKKNRSKALFAGYVIRSDIKINDQTGEYFYWALVETLSGCQFDVVIHRDLIEKGAADYSPPRPGNIVMGEFWLSGHLLQDLV